MRTLFFILLGGNILLAAWLILDRPEAVPQPPPVPADVPRLELLSEQQGAVRMSGEEPAGQVESEPGRAGQPRTCFSLGPFETEADARTLAGRLGDDTLSREIRRIQAEAEIGHWVFLPAMETREEALAVARELSDAGLRDYYVVTAGDEENTISLGLYSERSNAERRVDRLQELGFDPEMRRRTETVPRYWLDIATPPNGDRNWSNVLAGYPDASASQADCPIQE